MSSNSSENYESEAVPFDVTEYLSFDEELQNGGSDTQVPLLRYLHNASLPTAKIDRIQTTQFSSDDNNRSIIGRKRKSEGVSRVAFRTKSEHEILDDGYKWKKYGKKMVKATPHPRNYYRCAMGGCNVKKRVERQYDDSSYVITTYEGNHNHHAPSPAKALNVSDLCYKTIASIHEKHPEEDSGICLDFGICLLEENLVELPGKHVLNPVEG